MSGTCPESELQRSDSIRCSLYSGKWIRYHSTSRTALLTADPSSNGNRKKRDSPHKYILKNKKTGKEKIYSCPQYEKSYKDNVNNGKYSWFSAKIPGDINENKQENEVSVYLSADGVLYKQKIDLTEE